LIKDRKSSFQPICKAKGIDFAVTIDLTLPLQIYADQQKIAFIIDSLLDNAVKFTELGRIELAVSAQNYHLPQFDLIIAVRDSGIGIAAAHLNVIFEAFRQADASFSRSYAGIGLGLAMCQRFSAMMEGNINVRSQQGEGSEFKVALKVNNALTQPQQSGEQFLHTPSPALLNTLHPRAEKSGQHKILIVEDNTINQKVLCGMVKKLGHKTIVAENGLIAIDTLERETVDLVFMDCQMPVMDGFETTKAIRAGKGHCPNVPIIAVTANALSDDEQHCINAGMNDYLSKPISKDKIEAILKKWLDGGDSSAASMRDITEMV
jgi:CheY-like chemotaxis protein